MATSSGTTQFVFFRLKPSIRPEEPGNRDGELFLAALRAVRNQSEYISSAWGRTEEDNNNAVWVIEWCNATGAAAVTALSPFLDPLAEAIILHAELAPSLATTDTLTKNPVTEIFCLTCPSPMTQGERRQLDSDIIAFRKVMLEKVPEPVRPKSYLAGSVNRPATIQSSASPTGEALVYIHTIGWDTVDVHIAARETKEFKDIIAPLRQHLVPPPPGLSMRHVSFSMI